MSAMLAPEVLFQSLFGGELLCWSCRAACRASSPGLFRFWKRMVAISVTLCAKPRPSHPDQRLFDRAAQNSAAAQRERIRMGPSLSSQFYFVPSLHEALLDEQPHGTTHSRSYKLERMSASKTKMIRWRRACWTTYNCCPNISNNRCTGLLWNRRPPIFHRLQINLQQSQQLCHMTALETAVVPDSMPPNERRQIDFYSIRNTIDPI